MELKVFQDSVKEGAGVSFSPDGKYLLTGANDLPVSLWDVHTGKEVRHFDGLSGVVAFSPDGRYFLANSSDNTIRLLDVRAGQELRRFANSVNIYDLTFSPDDRYILASGEDGTARMWLTDLHNTIRAVCAVLSRDLTDEERSQFGISDQGPTCPAQ